MQSVNGLLKTVPFAEGMFTVQFNFASKSLCTSCKGVCCFLVLQGPVVYGAKVEDRFKATDKVKVLLASASLMNKAERHMPREQAWNHSVETRIKAGDDDRLAVSIPQN